MSAPWEKYAAPTSSAKPWEKYAPAKSSGKLPAETGNPLSRIGGAFTGAVDKLGKSVKADYAASAAGKDYGTLKSYGRKAGVLGDALNVVAAPVGQVFEEAVVKPYARAAAAVLPFTTEENNAADMRTALSAATFAKGKAPVVTNAPRAAKPTMADTVARFDKAGVRPSLAATRGKGTATVANVVAENPLAGVAVRGRLKGAVSDVGQSADRISTGYGSNRGAQIAGENVQAGVKRFAKDADAPTSFKSKSGKLYDDAFAAIPDQPVQPVAATQTLKDVLGRVNAPNLADTIKSPKIAQIADALTKDQGKVTFSDLRALRTWVREAQKTPELRQNMSAADLQRLEGALTDDIMASAGALGGPQAAQGLRRADQYYATGSKRIKGALEAFAKDGTPGESAYSRITQSASSGGRADARQLVSLKRSLSAEEWGDVAATQIKQMGQPSKGAVDALDPDAFSVNTFVTNYAKLSDRGREVLFGSTGGGGAKASALKAELDNLMSVASDLKGVEKGANASLSAVNAQTLATGGGLLTPATMAPTAGILGGMAITGEMLTNPVAVRALVALGRASRAGQPALARQLARLNAAAKSNVALVPVAQAANVLQMPVPAGAIRAAAGPTQEPQQ